MLCVGSLLHLPIGCRLLWFACAVYPTLPRTVLEPHKSSGAMALWWPPQCVNERQPHEMFYAVVDEERWTLA